jgi:TetR/AcrR family transcriptional regulator, regulator of autoinduction and epiphytic fitness
VASTSIEWGATNESGRALRSDSRRNRDAVVDALLGLYRDGNLQPSSTQIAERAGLSPRSLFRYFDDVDDLSRAAIARQLERVTPLTVLDVSDGAPLVERVNAFVGQRVRFHEAVGAIGIVSRLRAPFQPLIAEQLDRGRTHLRRQVGRVFAAELDTMRPADAAAVVAGIDVLCSFEAYQLLRGDQQQSQARATTTLVAGVTRLLGKS